MIVVDNGICAGQLTIDSVPASISKRRLYPLDQPVVTHPSPDLVTYEVGRTDDMAPWEGPSEFKPV